LAIPPDNSGNNELFDLESGLNTNDLDFEVFSSVSLTPQAPVKLETDLAVSNIHMGSYDPRDPDEQNDGIGGSPFFSNNIDIQAYEARLSADVLLSAMEIDGNVGIPVQVDATGPAFLVIDNLPPGLVPSVGTLSEDGRLEVANDQVEDLVLLIDREFFADGGAFEDIVFIVQGSNIEPIPASEDAGPPTQEEAIPENTSGSRISGVDDAEDDEDNTDEEETIVDIPNLGPVASNEEISASEDGGAVTGQLDASDVDGDNLTYSLVSGPSEGEGTVTINSDGSYSYAPGDDFQSLAAGETQEVTFTYQVDDGQGGTDTAQATVTVTGTNDGPVASAEEISASEDGGAVTGQLDASDVDGDNLTYSLVSGPSEGEGTVTINSDGSYSYAPGDDFQSLAAGETQEVTFTYQVDDGQGGTDTAQATVTVTGTNDGPVASAEEISASEDGGAVTGQLDASDVDGDNLTYSLVSGPSEGEGTVTINSDGSYSYAPGDDFQSLAAGETQEVTFTYQVDDGQGGTDTAQATVTVTGTNDGPVASAMKRSPQAKTAAR
jgi:VCBS repeat-containing protein